MAPLSFWRCQRRVCGADDSESERLSDERCRAIAVLAEIDLNRGQSDRARTLATEAFERDRAELSDFARARLHMALAAVDERGGSLTSARAALSRAASSGSVCAIMSAHIEARRAMCLAREGRTTEATRTLAAAEAAAREVDAVGVSDELRRCRALISARCGDMGGASAILREVVDRRRGFGDEIGALQAEIDLAQMLQRRGELAAAAELATACYRSASRRGLGGLAARARLISAAIELAELRVTEARRQLDELREDGAVDATLRSDITNMLALADAWSSKPAGLPTDTDGVRDDIDRGMLSSQISLAKGDSAAALHSVCNVAVRAERAGRSAVMTEALALVARLQLARGDRAAATAAASRAAREALSCGLTAARADALLVLSALAREDGEVTSAAVYAQDVAALAAEAGLSLQRLVAAQAMEVIADGDVARAREATEAQSAAAATMSHVRH